MTVADDIKVENKLGIANLKKIFENGKIIKSFEKLTLSINKECVKLILVTRRLYKCKRSENMYLNKYKINWKAGRPSKSQTHKKTEQNSEKCKKSAGCQLLAFQRNNDIINDEKGERRRAEREGRPRRRRPREKKKNLPIARIGER